MNWRNPFLTSYLAVTVVGAGLLGYLVYSSYSHYNDVAEQYDASVQKLQSLQNRTPFPNAENNKIFADLTAQYREEYQKLLAQAGSMQKETESITPQAFGDRLRAFVSEVEAAARDNGVALPENFYLGFDTYRGTLPSNEAAAPLARELSAIRLVVDKLIAAKVKSIAGIKRDLLPEEGGSSAPAEGTPAGRPARPDAKDVISKNTFEISFTSGQMQLRQSLNAIASADQFFIIRYLNIQNSSLEGPKRKAEESEEPAAEAAPASAADDVLGQLADNAPGAAPAAPTTKVRVLVGQETLNVAARIEILTFNTPAAKK